MKKIILILIITVLMAGCSKHDSSEEKVKDKEIIKQAEEGAAVMEELDEAEKGFWLK